MGEFWSPKTLVEFRVCSCGTLHHNLPGEQKGAFGRFRVPGLEFRFRVQGVGFAVKGFGGEHVSRPLPDKDQCRFWCNSDQTEMEPCSL